MTNEEIDAEIARLTAMKEQNNAQSGNSERPATGVYNPADYIGQITGKMNEAGYTDDKGNKQSYGRGDKFSSNLDVAKNAGRRTGFEQDRDGTPLPETAYEWITQQLNEARARGPVSKYTLRAIENGAKVRYNLPTKFDISGIGLGNTDNKMAKAMNSMSYNGNAQQPAQTPVKQEQPKTQQPVSPETKKDDERTAAYKRIKAKQASDADLALFKDYTEDELKKIGFGPVSIAAIKGTAKQTTQSPDGTVSGTTAQMKADIANGNVKPTYNENSIIGATKEELDAMKAQGLSDDLYNKGIEMTNNGGLSNEEQAFMQQYTKAAGSRKPEDRAFLTPENVKKYNDLTHRKTATKKVNKENKATEKRKQSIAAAKEDNAAYGDAGTFGE